MRAVERWPMRSLKIILILLSIAFMIIMNYSENISTSYFSNDLNVLKSASIEQLVQTVPNCTEHDKIRQRHLLKAIKAWIQFAIDNKIQYWLAYGTLVGYVQREGLLPHDPDVDILMLSSETEKLVPFLTKNFSSDYYLIIHPQWKLVGYENRSYFPEKGINFIAPNARFYSYETHHHIDIWPSYELLKNRSTDFLSEYDNGYNLSPYPKNWTFPLKRCSFSGLPTWCPNQPKRLVSEIYGPTSVNQSYWKCENKTWVSTR